MHDLSSGQRTRGGALGLAAAALLTFACAGPEAPRPPVVLITVDGLSADGLSVFGGPTPTPALESIAEAGAAWADGWTVSPMTRPPVATYLTGVAPDRHGVRDDIFTPLPEGIPTLAGLLARRGYQTAALPDSSLLGRSSGLLRDFEVADDPPAIPSTPMRWLSVGRLAAPMAKTTREWIDSVPAGEPYFVWVHFSLPLIAQVREAHRPREIGASARRSPGSDSDSDGTDRERPPDDYAEAVERFDEALAAILETIRDRRDLERALIVVASTQGDVGGGDEDPFGSGFSLHERAIRVPVFARFPAGSPAPRDGSRTVWAPDVPRTIAELTGTELSEQAEGQSLLAEPPEDRVIFSWSWAPLDQLGWRALRAARSRGVKRTIGYEVVTVRLAGADPVGQGEEQRLARALAERAEPAPRAVPLAEVEPVLVQLALTLEPVPAEGRDHGTAQERRTASWHLWRARYQAGSGLTSWARESCRKVLESDPDNLGARLDLGHMMSVMGNPESLEVLGRAAELYPGNPEVLHWLAHAIWIESWEQAETLLDAISSLKQQDPDVLYDLACTRSLGGDLRASEEYLRAAIEAGYRDWNWIQTDPDLRNLKESGRLSAVVGEYR